MAAPCWSLSPELSTACHAAQLSMPGSLGEGQGQLWLEMSILHPSLCPPPPLLPQLRANKSGQQLHSSPALGPGPCRLEVRQLKGTRELEFICKARLQILGRPFALRPSFNPTAGYSFWPPSTLHTFPVSPTTQHSLVSCPSTTNQSPLPRMSQYTTNGFRGPLPSGSMVKFPEVFPLSR